MSFWDIVWFIFIAFAFVFYLMLVFWILTDLFRDKDTSGWAKAVWVIALLIFPLLTALVYLIARGRGMSERQARGAAEAKRQQDEYIRDVAGKGMSPADQIAQARSMLDAGVITQTEFDRLKEKALV